MTINWAVLTSIFSSVLIAILMFLLTNARRDLQDKLKELRLKQDQIYEEVKETNGRVGKLETFTGMHEESDNRRFAALHEEIADLKP